MGILIGDKNIEYDASTLLQWESGIKKKINSITLISIANLAVGLVYFLSTRNPIINTELIFALLSLPIVLLINQFQKYILATYWFYFTDFIFTVLITLKLGYDSYIIISFFPMIISMMHLLGRKETFKHLFILSGACLASIVVIIVGLQFGNFTIDFDPQSKAILASIIIVLCFTTTIILTIMMIREYIQQENISQKALAEKDILLAEVYHRVKNNLNIVTSLLNLKKNTTDSQEVIDALEVCQNRVFSIALVHQSIVNNPKTMGLNFKFYIETLAKEIQNTLAIEEESEINISCDEIQLDISKAIPCGLILNELITNSFKHGQVNGRKLKIEISLKQNKESVTLIMKDNGPGIANEKIDDVHKMGLDLIKALADQLDASFNFENQDGLKFNLSFSTNEKKGILIL